MSCTAATTLAAEQVLAFTASVVNPVQEQMLQFFTEVAMDLGHCLVFFQMGVVDLRERKATPDRQVRTDIHGRTASELKPNVVGYELSKLPLSEHAHNEAAVKAKGNIQPVANLGEMCDPFAD